jgi:hypothetical protein
MTVEEMVPGEEQDGELREVALKRLKKRRDFGAHLLTYIVVNAVIVGIWLTTGRGGFWPMWVMMLWGIGLVLNAWDVFGRREITEADVRREMDKMRAG